MTKHKYTLMNMATGLIFQIFTILSGFILPKIILSYFGSDVNGLIASINQFLAYIGLIEGGVTSVIMANLYAPLVNCDDEKLSSVMTTANAFFKKVGFIFIAYTVVVALVYPVIFKTQFGILYVCALTVILSVNLLIQYMFSLSLKTLLIADKRGYIVNLTQTVIVIFNVLLAIVSVKIYPSIHALKLVSGLLFVMQPIVFGSVVKKHYRINKNAKKDNSLIKERWNGFSINLAAFIHNSTDATVLTIFTTLKTVSVYSVYCLISTGLKQLITACISGITPTIGLAYAKKDFDDLNQKMSLYEYVVFILVFYLFTTATLLITPFVMLYTKNITDANYYQPLFGLLLLISEALYLVKFPHLQLAYSANKFKEIAAPAYVEAFLNIIISVLLVRNLGLVGVAIGTIVGMTYRMVFHVYYTSKIIPGRKQSIFYKKFFIFSVTAILGYFVCHRFVPLTEVSVGNWISYAVIYSLILGVLYGAISWIFFRKELKFFLHYLKKR